MQESIADLKKKWLDEEKVAISGWDFSHLDGRWQDDDLSWDYISIVKSRLKPTDRILDIGTGGGEALLTLGHPYGLTSVTEDYPPNFDLCSKRLKPLGITVAKRDNGKLPFDDHSFDTVIDRHEECDFSELARVIKKGGLFITQQVGGMNNRMMSKRLIKNFVPPYPGLNLASFSKSLEEAGFEIEYSAEMFPVIKFFDIGALVWFAKIIEWEFPDFSVEGSLDALVDCQRELEREGFVKSVEHRFVIVAKYSAA